MGSSGYTKGEITSTLDEIVKSGELSSLYQEDCTNYTGKTTDTKDLYSDLIAEWLVERNVKGLFVEQVKPISRRETYKTADHKPMTPEERDSIHEQRQEEQWIARSLLHSKFDHVGEIIDYQTPIKDSHDDKGVGKVDLLAYCEDGKVLSIIELKRKRNEETVLHAILEVCTYYHQLDKEKLKADFGYPASVSIQQVVLGFTDSFLHQQYRDSKIIQKLAKELGVKVCLLDDNQIIEIQ